MITTYKNTTTLNLDSKAKQGKPDRENFKLVNHPSEVLSLNFSQFSNIDRITEPLISKPPFRTRFSTNLILPFIGLFSRKTHRGRKGKTMDFEQSTIKTSGAMLEHDPGQDKVLGALKSWIQ